MGSVVLGTLGSLLPVVADVALFLILLGSGMPARRALLATAVAWGVGVVAITEALSTFRLVTRGQWREAGSSSP